MDPLTVRGPLFPALPHPGPIFARAENRLTKRGGRWTPLSYSAGGGHHHVGGRGALGAPSLGPTEKSNEDGLSLVEKGQAALWGGGHCPMLEGAKPGWGQGRVRWGLSVSGSCHDAWTELRGLGKTQFKDPHMWTCLDLSFGGSGTSRGMSSREMKSTRWEPGSAQVLCSVCGVRLPVRPCPAASTSPFPMCPRLAPWCARACAGGSRAEEAAPHQTQSWHFPNLSTHIIKW